MDKGEAVCSIVIVHVILCGKPFPFYHLSQNMNVVSGSTGGVPSMLLYKRSSRQYSKLVLWCCSSCNPSKGLLFKVKIWAPKSWGQTAATLLKTYSCCMRISSMSAFSVLLFALRALSSSFSNSVRWAFFIASIAKATDKKKKNKNIRNYSQPSGLSCKTV